MDLYQKQQFGFLLQTATERYVARLEERFRGPDAALTSLREDPDGEGVWLTEFAEAVFEDFLLNNVEGACFVLQALATRPVAPVASGPVASGPVASGTVAGGTVGATLGAMAKRLFADLLLQKAIELLEQHSGYQSV